MRRQKPLHWLTLVTGRAFARIGATRSQAKSLRVSHHHGEDRQGAVEHAGAFDKAVAPEQDVALRQFVDAPVAERAEDFLEDGALVALAGRWFPVSRIVSPEAFGVITQQRRIALLRSAGLRACRQPIQRHLCQFRPREASGRGGRDVAGSPKRHPPQLAALAEQDKPRSPAAGIYPKPKARQVYVPILADALARFAAD